VAGPDVHALYAAGALDRIAAYCMTDVVQTWLLFLRYRLVDGSLTRDGHDESVASVRRDLPSIARRNLAPTEAAHLDRWLDRSAPFFGDPAPARQAL